MPKFFRQSAIAALLLALSGPVLAHHVEPEIRERAQKTSDKVEELLMSADVPLSERMTELYNIRSNANELYVRYTDHPDTAELAKGVREEANDAWQRLFKQKIADEEAA